MCHFVSFSITNPNATLPFCHPLYTHVLYIHQIFTLSIYSLSVLLLSVTPALHSRRVVLSASSINTVAIEYMYCRMNLNFSWCCNVLVRCTFNLWKWISSLSGNTWINCLNINKINACKLGWKNRVLFSAYFVNVFSLPCDKLSTTSWMRYF